MTQGTVILNGVQQNEESHLLFKGILTRLACSIILFRSHATLRMTQGTVILNGVQRNDRAQAK